MMNECPDCEYDEVDDLEYCSNHQSEIMCKQCGINWTLYFESDYIEVMETGNTTCLACAIENRIKELEKKEMEKE